MCFIWSLSLTSNTFIKDRPVFISNIKEINGRPIPLTTLESLWYYLWFSDDFKGDRSLSIPFDLLSIRKENWQKSFPKIQPSSSAKITVESSSGDFNFTVIKADREQTSSFSSSSETV